jgi:hypothetical protein
LAGFKNNGAGRALDRDTVKSYPDHWSATGR